MPITQEGRAVVRYESIFCDPSTNIDAAGQAAANWQIGQDFEEFEQERKERAGYGEEINKKPAEDPLCPIRPRILASKRVANERFLLYLANTTDGVCRILADRHRLILFAAVVCLCATAHSQEYACP